MSLKNKFRVNPMETFFAKWKKTRILTYFGLIQGKKGTKNIAPGTYILHNSKSSSNEFEKQISYESSTNFLQNRQKPEFWPI